MKHPVRVCVCACAHVPIQVQIMDQPYITIISNYYYPRLDDRNRLDY